MPDSEVARIVALVPSCRGENSSSFMSIRARPSWVSAILVMVPTGRPPTCTWSPFTSWPALTKTAWTLYAPDPPNMSTAATTIAATPATAARIRGRRERSSSPSPRDEAGLAVARGAKCESHKDVGTSQAASSPYKEDAAAATRLDALNGRFAYGLPQVRDYSMPSGPRASPERNCRTNWLSELNNSSAGPDSTILPFHRIAMYSATRRADMMSCVITT